MIKQEVIEKVKESANIVDVIGDFVHLKPSGQNFKGLSPFVEERKPSFFVSPSKNIFKCFKSEIGGDSVKFLMEKEHYSFIEAIRYLAQKYNIDLEEEVEVKKETKDKKLTELPGLLVELERLSSQVENHDTSKVSTEIETIKNEILYLKDQKFKLVQQLSKTSFSIFRDTLDKLTTGYKETKKMYDEADSSKKKDFVKTLNLKSAQIKEVRGLIVFKHLLE